MKSLKEVTSIMFVRPTPDCPNPGQIDDSTLKWGSLFLAGISLVLTILNMAMGYWLMARTTALLSGGFILAAILIKLGMPEPSRVIMAFICAVGFSYYALAGQNEGFAILWIVLVPVLGMFLVGLKIGFLLSLYFQVFLIVLFYTPLSSIVSGYYTQTFAARFPILYFTCFCAVTFLMYQRQKFYIEACRHSNCDALTGLLNRCRLREIADELDSKDAYGSLSVACLDLNRLKWVNDTLGHAAGDNLICAAAKAITESFPGDLCFRTGGDEFTVISLRPHLDDCLNGLRSRADAWKGENGETLSFAVGVASRVDNPGATYQELADLADRLMYQDKDAYYRKAGICYRRGAESPEGCTVAGGPRPNVEKP